MGGRKIGYRDNRLFVQRSDCLVAKFGSRGMLGTAGKFSLERKDRMRANISQIS